MTSVLLSHKKVYPKNCINNYMELISLNGSLNTHPPFSIKAVRILIYSWPWNLGIMFYCTRSNKLLQFQKFFE